MIPYRHSSLFRPPAVILAMVVLYLLGVALFVVVAVVALGVALV